MIPGGAAPDNSRGDHLAYLDLPGKPRTFVRRLGGQTTSYTAVPQLAHRFESPEAAMELISGWAPKAHAAGLTGTTTIARAVRAHGRTAVSTNGGVVRPSRPR